MSFASFTRYALFLLWISFATVQAITHFNASVTGTNARSIVNASSSSSYSATGAIAIITSNPHEVIKSNSSISGILGSAASSNVASSISATIPAEAITSSSSKEAVRIGYGANSTSDVPAPSGILTTSLATLPNNTTSYPCPCTATVPQIDIVYWKSGNGTPDVELGTNKAGTIFTSFSSLISTTTVGSLSSNVYSMFTLEFPSRLTSYDDWYTAEGYMPHIDGTQTQCGPSIFRTIVNLPSPSYSGPASPVPTVPANNSGGHGYYPVSFPKDMHMTDWHYFQSAFPDFLALQYCHPVLVNVNFEFKPPIAITKHTLEMPSRYPEPTPAASGTVEYNPAFTHHFETKPPIALTSIFGPHALPGPSFPPEGTSPTENPAASESVPNHPTSTRSEETANSASETYKPIIIPSDHSLQTPVASIHVKPASSTPPQPQETADVGPLGSAINSIAHEQTQHSTEPISAVDTVPTELASSSMNNQHKTDTTPAQPIGAPFPTDYTVLGSAGTSAVIVGTHTLKVGQTITLGSGSSTTEVALVTNSLGQTELIRGQSTANLNPSSEPSVPHTSGHATVVNGNTLAPDSPITLGSGSSATEVALVTNSRGETEIVHNRITAITAASSGSVFGFPLTTIPIGIVIGSKTLEIGSKFTLGQGAATTIFALSTDDAGQTEIIQGHSTVTNGASKNGIGTAVITQNGAIVIGSKTLELGSTITLGFGSAATEIALRTDALGQTEIVQGHSTAVIAPSGSAFGESVSPISSGIVIAGKTLEIGSTITLGSGASTTQVALETNDLGQTEVIEGRSREVLPPSATSEGLVVSSGASGAVVIDGHTLNLGSTITLGSGAQTTEIALETNSLGQTEVVAGTTTELLTTGRMGSYILSGMQAHQPTDTTAQPTSSGVPLSSAAGQPSASKANAGSRLLSRPIEMMLMLFSMLGGLFLFR